MIHSKANKHLIIIPGLSDDISLIKLATKHWKKYRYSIHIHRVGWKDKGNTFQNSLNNLLGLVDKLITSGSVSILGISAGGSLAINAINKRNSINYVINLCGRLKVGNHKYRSLERMSNSSSIFKDSVISSDNILKESPKFLKDRVLSISSKYFDQSVPFDTSFVDEANNIQIHMIEHTLCIYYTLLFEERAIFDFISKK